MAFSVKGVMLSFFSHLDLVKSMITTSQNKQVKRILKLKKSARERRKEQLFLVEGIRMFEEIPAGKGCGTDDRIGIVAFFFFKK